MFLITHISRLLDPFCFFFILLEMVRPEYKPMVQVRVSLLVCEILKMFCFTLLLHLSDHLTMHLDWFVDSWWWIQNIAMGQWDHCSDVGVTCQFKTVKHFSELILCWQTLLIRQNLSLPGWTSLAYPIGGVSSPCLSLDSSGPCAWQLLPLEAGLSHVLLLFFLFADSLWEFFMPSVHFLVCYTKTRCDNQLCCFLGGILCFHKCFWSFSSCVS